MMRLILNSRFPIPVGLIPVYLSGHDLAAFEVDFREPLPLSPAPWAIAPPEPRDFPNPRSGGDGLRILNFAQNFKGHGAAHKFRCVP
jgi:hypothetical protein